MSDMPDEDHLDEALLQAAREQAVPTITVRPVTYYVTGLPEDDENCYTWMFTVEWRGPGDLWAVMYHGRCWSTTGSWDLEPSPSNRDDEFKATHRFPFDTAIDFAVTELPNLCINGLVIRDGKLVKP